MPPTLPGAGMPDSPPRLSSARGTGRTSSASRPAAARTIAWTRNAAWKPSTAATAGAVPARDRAPVRCVAIVTMTAMPRTAPICWHVVSSAEAPPPSPSPAPPVAALMSGTNVSPRPNAVDDQRRQQVRRVVARRLQAAHEPQPGAADDRPDSSSPRAERPSSDFATTPLVIAMTNENGR